LTIFSLFCAHILIFDNNNIDDLKKFAENLKFKHGVTQDDEMFVFGQQYGNGDDKNHFHMGMTSLTLLNNINKFKVNDNGMYHIDATYKIVKYNYPLIVFGFTDIERKFFPLCFMYSSHETELDYDHFFLSFAELCDMLEINFQPKFIVTDAWQATANSITKLFPECQIIMCYFHIKLILIIVLSRTVKINTNISSTR
jgi:hypothetical protein